MRTPGFRKVKEFLELKTQQEKGNLYRLRHQFLHLRTEAELNEFVYDKDTGANVDLDSVYEYAYKYISTTPIKNLPLFVNHPTHSIQALVKKRLKKG